MKYKLVQRDPGVVPPWWSDSNADSLFAGDWHSACTAQRERCDRSYFVIERIPELNEIFENDFYHA